MNPTYLTVALDQLDTIEKGAVIEVRTQKGDAIEGEFISINSKGINVRYNGRVVTRSLASIAQVALVVSDADTPADLFEDGQTYTTAELAAIFEMSARELRIQLRAMDRGVGKGHTYEFTAADAREIHGALTNAS